MREMLYGIAGEHDRYHFMIFEMNKINFKMYIFEPEDSANAKCYPVCVT